MKPHVVALAIATLLVPVAAQSPKAEFRSLEKEYAQEVATYRSEIQRLETAGKDTSEYRIGWNPIPAFVELMAEQAAENAGTEDAVQFLYWILQYDSQLVDGSLSKGSTATLAILLKDHSESEEFWRSIAGASNRVSLSSLEHVVALTSAIVDASPPHLLLTSALFSRVQARMDAGSTSASDTLLCKVDLAELRRITADDNTNRLLQFKRAEYDLDNLQIGSVAPDIIGVDLDGVEFKLSDYRGKVVLLDFWGDW